MKKSLLSLLAVGVLALAAAPAQAKVIVKKTVVHTAHHGTIVKKKVIVKHPGHAPVVVKKKTIVHHH